MPATKERYKKLACILSREALVEQYVNNKKSLNQISAETGATRETVANYLRRHGISVDSRGGRRGSGKLSALTQEEYRRLYLGENLTNGQIGEVFGVSGTDVWIWAKIRGFNIKLTEAQRNARASLAARRAVRTRVRKERRVSAKYYTTVNAPGHNLADPDGYVEEHRFVAQNAIGRLLTPDDKVHHINMDKWDNVAGNLAVLTASQHHRTHGYYQRCGVYLAGLSTKKPLALVFKEGPVFWGGKWVSEIDLCNRESA